MKKLMMMAVLLAGAGGFADDQFLYWMVNPYDTEFHTAGRAFDYAYLTVTDQGGVKLTDGSGNAVHLESFVPDGDAMISLGAGVHADGDPTALTTLPVFSSLGAYASTSYGFVVEAYLDGDLLWTSGVSYYEALAAANSVWNGKGSAMSGDLSAATFMVPEPTSGLLLLLGVAGLMLRRRRNAM